MLYNPQAAVKKLSISCVLLMIVGQLIACSSSATLPSEALLPPETSEGKVSSELRKGGASAPADSLPRPLRLAFMAGHVRAGIALYRAGELEMAAPHLLHPVSETHQAEREGLEGLGFDRSLYVRVSGALEANRPAVKIENLLVETEANLALVTSRAGGDHLTIIEFLLRTIIDEYSLSINDGKLTDVGEYQDAYGFSQVAIEHARALPVSQRGDLLDALQQLALLWPTGPMPTDSPTPVAVLVDAVNALLERFK
jgi:hypothetical protein